MLLVSRQTTYTRHHAGVENPSGGDFDENSAEPFLTCVMKTLHLHLDRLKLGSNNARFQMTRAGAEKNWSTFFIGNAKDSKSKRAAADAMQHGKMSIKLTEFVKQSTSLMLAVLQGIYEHSSTS